MEESLEHIRESAETRMRKNAFMLHNYIELERVEKDRAVFKLDIRPESCNPYGLIHGGAIYTLADNATGAAAHSDGRYYVTQTSALHFLRNQATGTVRASAWVRHRGKSTVLEPLSPFSQTLWKTGLSYLRPPPHKVVPEVRRYEEAGFSRPVQKRAPAAGRSRAGGRDPLGGCGHRRKRQRVCGLGGPAGGVSAGGAEMGAGGPVGGR